MEEQEQKKKSFLNNKKQVKGKALSAWVIVMILIFMMFIFGLGIFLGKELFAKNEKKSNNKSEPKQAEVAKKDMINDGSRVGYYTLYMGKTSNGNEYSLTLFAPSDKNDGYITLVEASTLSFNQVASGYYKINGSNIEFYQNMENDSDKNGFVNAFSMTIGDLYQDATALSEGYSTQYRLKLNYEQNKISNTNLVLNKIN